MLFDFKDIKMMKYHAECGECGGGRKNKNRKE